jgi:hypothetical protein
VSAKTIDEVVVRLQSIEQALARDDGLRWFNRLYRDVTLAVRDYCGSGQLKAGPFLPQLDVYFGNRYFDAFDAAASGAHVPKCWSPLFEARHNRSIAPLQFALAGMNAHISHDLSMGVVDTCEALGIAPSDGSPQHRDYRAVNGILKTTESKTKQWLLTGATRQLDHEVAPLDDAVGIWSIERARDAAWTQAQLLWHLRNQRQLLQAYLAMLDATVGMEGRALLLPHVV